MALRLYSGGILARGGALATSDACCCGAGYCNPQPYWFYVPPHIDVSATVFIPDVGQPGQCAAGSWPTTLTLAWFFQPPPSAYYFYGCGNVPFVYGQTGRLQIWVFCDQQYGHYAMATLAPEPCGAPFSSATCGLPGGGAAYTTYGAGFAFGPFWNNAPQNVVFNFPFGIQAICQITLRNI